MQESEHKMEKGRDHSSPIRFLCQSVPVPFLSPIRSPTHAIREKACAELKKKYLDNFKRSQRFEIGFEKMLIFSIFYLLLNQIQKTPLSRPSFKNGLEIPMK